MTVSKQTLLYLAEGVIFLHKNGHGVGCNLAYGIDWSDESDDKILCEQLMALINFYLEHPEVEPCELLGRSIMNVASEENIFNKSCGAGIEDITYDVDGVKYPCQFFVPMSCGEEKAKASRSMHFYKDVIPKELIDPLCLECPIKGACMNCYGSNFITTGNIYYHDRSFCRLTKITVKAKAYFQAQLWERGLLKLDEDEEIALLKSIKLINEKVTI